MTVIGKEYAIYKKQENALNIVRNFVFLTVHYQIKFYIKIYKCKMFSPLKFIKNIEAFKVTPLAEKN